MAKYSGKGPGIGDIFVSKYTDRQLIGMVLALGGLGWLITSKVKASIEDTATATRTAVNEVLSKDLNPASDQNLIYRGVNSLGEQISGQKGWSLGGWLYDVTH